MKARELIQQLQEIAKMHDDPDVTIRFNWRVHSIDKVSLFSWSGHTGSVREIVIDPSIEARAPR